MAASVRVSYFFECMFWIAFSDKGLFHLYSRYVVQILVHSHFDLVSWLLAVEATKLVSEPLTQMAVELINILFDVKTKF